MNDLVARWRKDRRSFHQVAEPYDMYRPNYPVLIIEAILSITSIPKDGSILEIGSGTGKATLPFAQRGYSILGIEPGKLLIDVARQKLQDFPKVKFQVTTFEDWQSQGQLFDAVLSAQAFHWVAPEIRYQKTASVLKPRGYLVLLWNQSPPLASSIAQKLSQVYEQYAPELAQSNPRTSEESTRFWTHELEQSQYFDLIEVKRFSWRVHYTTDQYLGLLQTYSDHMRLPVKGRQQLLKGIETVLEQGGGGLEKPYETVAYLARKRSLAVE